MENRRKLESWKEIAAYLNREVRTVQRWEGLPVHRMTVRERSRVYAFTDELDEWVRVKSNEGASVVEEVVEPVVEAAPARRRWWMGAVVGAVVVIVMLTAASLYPRRGGEVGEGGAVGHERIFTGVFTGKVRTIGLPEKALPFRAVLGRDERTLYVADYQLSAIHVADLGRGELQRTIELGARPGSMEGGGTGGEVYISAEQGDLFVLRDGVVRKLRQLPGAITDMVYSQRERKLFVAVPADGLWVYREEDGGIERVSAVRCPQNLQLSERHKAVYVFYQCGGPTGRPGHDSIEVLDEATHARKGILQGPPMVGAGFALTAEDTMLVTLSHTACTSEEYDQAGCVKGYPVTMHLFQPQDRRLIRSQGVSGRYGIQQAVPGSTRIVLVGETGMEVVDVASGQSLERISMSGGLTISEVRKEAYLMSGGKVTVLETGMNLEPEGRGLTEFWPGDGTLGNAKGMYGVRKGSAPRYARGIVGQAFEVGPGEAITMTADHTEPMKSTIGFWVRFEGEVEARKLARRFDGDGHGWEVRMTEEGRVRFGVGRDGEVHVEGRTKMEPGRWHHVSASHGEGEISLWLDGQLAGRRAAGRVGEHGGSYLGTWWRARRESAAG